MTRSVSFVGSLVILVALIAFAAPNTSNAVSEAGTGANKACFPYVKIDGCGCGMQKGPKGCVSMPANRQLCPCGDSTNLFGSGGQCMATGECKTNSTNGGGLGDPSKLLEMAQKIMQMMQQPPGGGGGAGSGAGSTACTQYRQVSTPSSDPCDYYVPGTSSSIDFGTSTLSGSGAATSDLLNALLGSGGTNTGGGLSGLITATASTSGTIVLGSTTATGYIVPLAGLGAGVTGDIRIIDGGATILVSNQNPQNNSIVAGFYGSNSGSAQPQGLVASWCQSRPWSNNFLSFLFPATFFDSLCTLRGYKVGMPVVVQVAPKVVVTQTPKPATTVATSSTPAAPVIPPQADIWATPASVPLGARTTIFWNAKGVTSCTETSADGSFSQSSLSGGAATVPLSGATIFSISCITPSGGHIDDSVTVNLAI